MVRHMIGIAVCVNLLLSFASSQGQEAAAKSGPGKTESPLAPFTRFSATMTGGLLKDVPRKVYRSENLFRVDLDGVFHVTDLIRNTTWSVHPDRCSRFSSPDVRSYPFSVLNTYKVERQPTGGKETVDAHPCRIENATFIATDDRPPVKMKLWEAEDLEGFPVKIEIASTTRTFTVTFQDVKLEAPDQSLFKLPTKCPVFRGNVKVGGPMPPSKPKASPTKKP
jgi:hypothetical protein